MNDIKRVTIGDKDVIVLMVERAASQASVEIILARTKSVFPDNKILLLEEGMKIGVVGLE